jgi:hypothetical protein
MDSTVPADLLKHKDRLEAWRANRKYTRQPIPDEFRLASTRQICAGPLGGSYPALKLKPPVVPFPLYCNSTADTDPDHFAQTVTNW